MNLRLIEEIALNSWPSLQQMFFDGWILRFSKGYTKRANSVNALYPGDLQVTEKVKTCEQIYATQGLPPVFRLTSFNQPDELDLILQKQGYQRLDLTSVQCLDLQNISVLTSAGFQIWDNRHLNEWLEVFSRLSGKSGAVNPVHRELLEHIPSPKILTVLRREEQIVSCALVVKEGDYLGLFDMVTGASSRNQGNGKKLLSSILKWGKQEGAHYAYLQVVNTNKPAMQLYAQFGYQEIYHYWYRVQDQHDFPEA
ncbi:MAG: GNAT family N-acetyltransferase [SAR324 cluster bacterium]|nr:GNAT family N-acetyltransferase [SAR324 cluster bacterium]